MIVWVHYTDGKKTPARIFFLALRDTIGRDQAASRRLVERVGIISWAITGLWRPRPYRLERIP